MRVAGQERDVQIQADGRDPDVVFRNGPSKRSQFSPEPGVLRRGLLIHRCKLTFC